MKKSAIGKNLRAGPSQKAGESRGTKVSSPVYTEGATIATTSKGRTKGAEAERLAGSVSRLSSGSDCSMETVASLPRSETGKTRRASTRSTASSSQGLESPRCDSRPARVPEMEPEEEADASMEELPAAGPSSRAGKVEKRRKHSASEEERRKREKRSEQSSRLSEDESSDPVLWEELEETLDISVQMLRRWYREQELPLKEVEYLEGAFSMLYGGLDNLKDLDLSKEVARLKRANKAQRAKHEERSREMTSRLEQAQAHAQAQAEALVKAQALIEAQAQAAKAGEGEMERRIAERIGALVSARIEGLEVSGRLLPERSFRPPLEADRRREAAAATVVTTRPSPPEEAPRPASRRPVPMGPQPGSDETMEWSTVVKKGKKAKGKRVPAPAPATAAKSAPTPRAPAAPAPRPQAPQERQWSEVVKRGPKKKRPPSTKEKAAMLHPPRTAAVVITLHPAAEERGVTYRKVVSEAVDKISLADLGVPHLKVREAMTGARVIEVPGEEREEKADALASKLREVFASEVDIVVSRPEITTDLRVTGLDDSIDQAKLTAALANAGGCQTTAISAGVIKKGPAGMGTVYVRCPLTAAKKMVAAGGGRLLVGWSAAQVRLLDRRPRRCYRCLRLGHVSAQCDAEEDRSDECYRCGQIGHKAAACSAAPHCSLCAAAGKPADHLSGGKACASPPIKKRTRGRRPRRDPSPME